MDVDKRQRLRRRMDRHYFERAMLLVLVVLYVFGFRADARRGDEIQDGRKTSQTVFCATASAVIDAGRGIITGGQPKPGTPLTPLERSLQRLGYPSREERRVAAQRAAMAYGERIATAVRAQTHIPDVVRADGTLDCARLAGATGTK